jgi:PmbA protein
MKPVQEQLGLILDLAKQGGAEADVILSQNRKLALKAHAGAVSDYTVASTRAVGIRVIRDGRVGTSYSETLDDEPLEYMVQQALNNARLTRENPQEQICAIGHTIETNHGEILQEDSVSTQEKIQAALQLEAGILDKPLSPTAPYNAVSDTEYEFYVANTQGSFCTHRERQVSCYTSALIDSDGQQSMYFSMQARRRFDALDVNLCVEDAYTTAYDLLHGGPIATGTYSVIFSVDSLKDVLGAFGSAFDGESAMKGLNPLRDKIGEMVASPCLHLSDIPNLTGGMSIASFDDEGFPARRTTLIKQGNLETLLHNSVTADHFTVANTANASRSPKGGLGISPRHLHIAAGTEQNPHVGEYLEIVSLQGTHSGANAVTGNFSFGASGFLCRDGVRCQPVRGITVASNFYEMLNHISALGTDQTWSSDGTLFAPTIRFDACKIGGK